MKNKGNLNLSGIDVVPSSVLYSILLSKYRREIFYKYLLFRQSRKNMRICILKNTGTRADTHHAHTLQPLMRPSNPR